MILSMHAKSVKASKATISAGEPSVRVKCGGCKWYAHPVLVQCRSPHEMRGRWHYRCLNTRCKRAGETVHRSGTVLLDE